MAAPPYTTAAFLERHRVAPPPDSPAHQEFPLLHFDMIFLSGATQLTFFYQLTNCSKSHFLQTIVPTLLKSLSLSLKHHLPLAGNIVLPAATNSAATPSARYVAGDALSVTVAESSQSAADFLHLAGNRPRDADELDALVPHFPKPTLSSDSAVLLPASAVQITLFPSQGFCIGWTYQHSICDGTSLVGFLNTWASVNKCYYSNGRQTHDFHAPPFYDRTTALEAPHELDLRFTYWNQMKKKLMTSAIQPPPQNNITIKTFRATFVLTDTDIQRLKNFTRRRRPTIVAGHGPSSFTVVCAHIWVCLAKLAAATEKVADDEPEYFRCPVDCRALLNPSLPRNYFGNCLGFAKGEINHATLKGEDGIGFLAAVEVIGESIRRAKELRIRHQNKVDALVNYFVEDEKLKGKRALLIAGSPSRPGMYGFDFGLGKMKKYDHVSNGRFGGVSLSGSKGGVEFGFNLPKMEMDFFAAIFDEVLLNGYNIPAPKL